VNRSGSLPIYGERRRFFHYFTPSLSLNTTTQNVLSLLSKISGNSEEQRRLEKMKLHLLRRVLRFPARWPVSHHGGAAALETSNSFFLKNFLHRKLPLFFLYPNPGLDFANTQPKTLDLSLKSRHFLSKKERKNEEKREGAPPFGLRFGWFGTVLLRFRIVWFESLVERLGFE